MVGRVDGRVAVLTLVALVAVGCYRSHERDRRDGDVPVEAGALADAAGDFVPHCNAAAPRYTTECVDRPEILLWVSELRGTTSSEGQDYEACLCSPSLCSRFSGPRSDCTSRRLPHDTRSLECAMYVPEDPARGFCVRPCETTAECPGGMLCLSIVETLGVTVDIERACFDVSPMR